tara:strand:- start:351 stop:500 length:150 start_codon:yes stop_codon:yes gene_type:complete
MLADPALGSTTMFRHKKMVGKNTHQIQLGRKTMKLFTPYGTTKPTDYSD